MDIADTHLKHVSTCSRGFIRSHPCVGRQHFSFVTIPSCTLSLWRCRAEEQCIIMVDHCNARIRWWCICCVLLLSNWVVLFANANSSSSKWSTTTTTAFIVSPQLGRNQQQLSRRRTLSTAAKTVLPPPTEHVGYISSSRCDMLSLSATASPTNQASSKTQSSKPPKRIVRANNENTETESILECGTTNQTAPMLAERLL